MDNELKNEIASLIDNLGDSEFQLALTRAENKDVKTIKDLIEEWRKPFAQGRIFDNGTGQFASKETWLAIQADSEKAARGKLLESSAIYNELTDLERKAQEAKRAAEAKERELQALWSEHQDLPQKIQRVTERLNGIPAELAAIDTEKLEAEFRQLYRETLDGRRADMIAEMRLAGLLVTAQLRRKELNALADELEAEFSELKARQKALGKQLGQKSKTKIDL